jgi:hypothetical protein
MGKSTNIFFEHLLKASPINFQQISPEELKEIGEAHHNHIFDLDGPRSIKRKPLPAELWYHRRIFAPYSAIFNSYEALQDSVIYFRRFPYHGSRVSAVNHLRRNINVYLQEIYILRQRMIDYLNILEKDYVGCPQGTQLKSYNQPLCQTLKKSLQPIITARKNHVHGGGYDEEGLKRLDSLHLLATYTSKKDTDEDKRRLYIYKFLHKQGYQKERKRWVKLVQHWNSTIEKLIDAYCEIIDRILFTETGELIFPPLAKNYSPNENE